MLERQLELKGNRISLGNFPIGLLRGRLRSGICRVAVWGQLAEATLGREALTNCPAGGGT